MRSDPFWHLLFVSAVAVPTAKGVLRFTLQPFVEALSEESGHRLGWLSPRSAACAATHLARLRTDREQFLPESIAAIVRLYARKPRQATSDGTGFSSLHQCLSRSRGHRMDPLCLRAYDMAMEPHLVADALGVATRTLSVPLGDPLQNSRPQFAGDSDVGATDVCDASINEMSITQWPCVVRASFTFDDRLAANVLGGRRYLAVLWSHGTRLKHTPPSTPLIESLVGLIVWATLLQLLRRSRARSSSV